MKQNLFSKDRVHDLSFLLPSTFVCLLSYPSRHWNQLPDPTGYVPPNPIWNLFFIFEKRVLFQNKPTGPSGGVLSLRRPFKPRLEYPKSVRDHGGPPVVLHYSTLDPLTRQVKPSLLSPSLRPGLLITTSPVRDSPGSRGCPFNPRTTPTTSVSHIWQSLLYTFLGLDVRLTLS